MLEDVEIPLSAKLPPGHYALILGSGLFGTSGFAWLGQYDQGDDPVDFIYGDPFLSFFIPWNNRHLRMSVEGQRLSP